MIKPDKIQSNEYRYDSFSNGKVLLNKKKNHLPAMGWNSWNAFGSGNTEQLTIITAEKMKELELDKLGYEFIVLDDGCYSPVRKDEKLTNEPMKFPNGFRTLSEHIHKLGFKFGMYNDIGTNLCAGAAVGTYGHEMLDAKLYTDWNVDFLKVDNCYYLFDNATFSDAANVKYVYAPGIKSITLSSIYFNKTFDAVTEGMFTGSGIDIKKDAEGRAEYVYNIGTFDGTGPWISPVGHMSGELIFEVEVPCESDYNLAVNYVPGCENGIGTWLQVAVGEGGDSVLAYDDFVSETGNVQNLKIRLHEGFNYIRIMNHRRQENTLNSYAKLLEGLNAANPDHDIRYSICEWGKTQPQNWGYKVGDSWRILNDITFRVGSDGNPGFGSWKDDYTPSITSQYNKAVIMDEFSGLDKGWNDPDMLVIGMDGLTEEMNRTHMAMWCMMNSPLMLGLDLRRIIKDDDIYNIIANKELIALNQDALGIQAKRIYSTLATGEPDKEYIRDINRADILAKPLADGSVALSFINVSEKELDEKLSVSKEDIIKFIGSKMKDCEAFANASSYKVKNLWSGEEKTVTDGVFTVDSLKACDNCTVRIFPQ